MMNSGELTREEDRDIGSVLLQPNTPQETSRGPYVLAELIQGLKAPHSAIEQANAMA